MFTGWGVHTLVSVVLILIFSLGATGTWYAIALANVTAAITGEFFFFRGRWLQDVLTDDSPEDTTHAGNGN